MWRLRVMVENEETHEVNTNETVHEEKEGAIDKACRKLFDFLYQYDTCFNLKSIMEEGAVEVEPYVFTWDIINDYEEFMAD